MKKQIFWVDDSFINLANAQKALMRLYEVIICDSVEAMFRFLLRSIPKLIILNEDMANMDGYEAIKMLKCNDTYKNIPVIFVFLSLPSRQSINKCMDLGAVGYIHMANDDERLAKLIEMYILEHTPTIT